MKISFGTLAVNLHRDRGFGEAAWWIIKSLKELGHDVPFKQPNTPVGISFCQPPFYDYYYNKNIGYTPWESSVLLPDWIEYMNRCDEVWTTSKWCKQVFEQNKIEKPIYVYEHGISDEWKPQRRTRKKTLKFLHIGEPAVRKGGQLALDGFVQAFGGQEDVSLTLKGWDGNNVRYKLGKHVVDPTVLKNVNVDIRKLPIGELQSYMYEFDALVYPSWGEGFGFIPLQATATGMPSITTAAWCPYKKYIMPLKSSIVESPWQRLHPGEMYKPDLDHLVRLYKDVYENYETHHARVLQQNDDLVKEFNWIKKTEQAFAHVVQ